MGQEVAWAGYPRHRENGKKKSLVRENTGNLEILSRHRENTEFCLNTRKRQGILLAQVVNVLILKVKGIVIVAEKKSFFSPEAG